MAAESLLEQRLRTLIVKYHDLGNAHGELSEKLAASDRHIRDLEQQCDNLRAQIDTLSKDRFTIKKLKDERDAIRRKLKSAMARLTALEQEL